MHHIRSRNIDRPTPSINELREAALSRNVSDKNVEDEEKYQTIRDTVEVEDNNNPAIHEEGLE